MEVTKIHVEIEGDVGYEDTLGIEDKIHDALVELGYEVKTVKVYW